MKKNIFFLFLSLFLVSCSVRQENKSLLDNTVLVNLNYNAALGSKNSLIFQFFKVGEYRITYGNPSNIGTMIEYKIHEPGVRIINETVEFIDKSTIHYPLKIVVLETTTQATDSMIFQ